MTIKKNILKLFCKLIFNKINAFITNGLIPDNQYGFRAGLSTRHQIIDLSYDITNCFNNENLICVDPIFLDEENLENSLHCV